MCKNPENPCPGCKKHKATDAAWMFFTADERSAIERAAKAEVIPSNGHTAT
ncbi:hypothetical protein [Loktanella sp. IMCC34160]|uniref:hypothetical protein n=1 Tax=Loktanella sp. IMCC34160 TaxID=2510646 RepID=UPI0013EA2885|nr:hypothetical protein [Loktanella sp. IMCC34160]